MDYTQLVSAMENDHLRKQYIELKRRIVDLNVEIQSLVMPDPNAPEGGSVDGAKLAFLFGYFLYAQTNELNKLFEFFDALLGENEDDSTD